MQSLQFDIQGNDFINHLVSLGIIALQLVYLVIKLNSPMIQSSGWLYKINAQQVYNLESSSGKPFLRQLISPPFNS